MEGTPVTTCIPFDYGQAIVIALQNKSAASRKKQNGKDGAAVACAVTAIANLMPSRLHSSMLKLLTCCSGDAIQLLQFLEEMVFATPEELGEVKAETTEERAERAERVLTAALGGLSALTQALCGPAAKKASASPSQGSPLESNGSADAVDSPGQADSFYSVVGVFCFVRLRTIKSIDYKDQRNKGSA